MNPLIPAIISGILGSIEPGTNTPQAPQGVIRPIPQGTTRAVMEPPEQGHARFGDKVFHLAPGLQIRDTQNRIIMPVAVRQPVAVRYLVDAGGHVNRVWLLTADEATRSDPE